MNEDSAADRPEPEKEPEASSPSTELETSTPAAEPAASAPSGPSPSGASPSPEVPKPPRPKRRLVLALMAMYGISVLAAVVLLMRAPDKNGGGKSVGGAAGLLSVAKKKDMVGLVSINGPIYRTNSRGMFEKDIVYWTKRIRRLSRKKEVKAIVISINSPGGSVGAVQEMYSQILRVRKETKKPFVAQLGDVAASGGYYLAAGCDKVVAHPGTLLGSIGVIFHSSNIEGLFKKVGIRSRVIKSGKMKDIGSMTRPMTEEERKLLQDLIDNAYGQFLKAVVDGRKLPEEKVRPLADGRIFTGEQALKNGLVDQLGDSRDAIKLAARLGGIKDAKPKVYRDADSITSVLELLETRLKGDEPLSAALLGELRQRSYTGLEYRWR